MVMRIALSKKDVFGAEVWATLTAPQLSPQMMVHAFGEPLSSSRRNQQQHHSPQTTLKRDWRFPLRREQQLLVEVQRFQRSQGYLMVGRGGWRRGKRRNENRRRIVLMMKMIRMKEGTGIVVSQDCQHSLR